LMTIGYMVGYEWRRGMLVISRLLGGEHEVRPHGDPS
jgi:hypothetical protein